MIASDVPLKNLRKLSERVRPPLNGDTTDASPFDTSVLYVVAFPAGKEPEEFATPRSVGIGR